jgi:hypothetical protein
MDPQDRSPWPFAAGCLALSLGILVALGSFRQPGDAQNAMQSRDLAIAAGALLAVAGGLLLGRIAFGRDLFLLAWPLAALALASNHPKLLWTEDIPYTLLAAGVFAPCAFFLSRPGAQLALGRQAHGWVSRGGVAALVALLLFAGLWAIVESADPETGGPAWPGFAHLGAGGSGFMGGMVAANAYVAKKASAIVLAVHALLAFVAVSIPPRAKDVAGALAGVSRAGTGILWIVACVSASLCAMLVWQVVHVRSVATGLLAAAAAGAMFGAVQSAVPVRLCRIGPLRWIAATAAGFVAGELLIAALVSAEGPEILGTRVAMAAFAFAVGAVQAVALRAPLASRIAWPVLVGLAAFVAAHVAHTLFPAVRSGDFRDPKVVEAANLRFLVGSAYRGFFGAVFTMQILWSAARAHAPGPPVPPPGEVPPSGP